MCELSHFLQSAAGLLGGTARPDPMATTEATFRSDLSFTNLKNSAFALLPNEQHEASSLLFQGDSYPGNKPVVSWLVPQSVSFSVASA